MKRFLHVFLISAILVFGCTQTTNNNYEKGISKAEKEDYQSALKLFDAAIKSDSSNADYFYARAYYAKLNLQDYDGAIIDFTKAIELYKGPEAANAYSFRGFARYKQKNYKSAVSDIQRALSLDPGNPFTYRNRALLFLEIKNQKMACKDLQQALDLGFTEQYGSEVKDLQKKYCQ